VSIRPSKCLSSSSWRWDTSCQSLPSTYAAQPTFNFNCQNQALRIGGSCDGCGSFTSSSLDFFLVAESSFFAICTAHSPRVQRFNFPWPIKRNLKNRDWDAGWRRILATFLALPANAALNFMYFTYSKHTSLAHSAGIFAKGG
jgi:hypothetical protein